MKFHYRNSSTVEAIILYPISAKVSVIGLFCAKMKFFVQEKLEKLKEAAVLSTAASLEKLKRAILGVSRGYHIRNYCNDN